LQRSLLAIELVVRAERFQNALEGTY
jgi:hypothetical protein